MVTLPFTPPGTVNEMNGTQKELRVALPVYATRITGVVGSGAHIIDRAIGTAAPGMPALSGIDGVGRTCKNAGERDLGAAATVIPKPIGLDGSCQDHLASAKIQCDVLSMLPSNTSL